MEFFAARAAAGATDAAPFCWQFCGGGPEQNKAREQFEIIYLQ